MLSRNVASQLGSTSRTSLLCSSSVGTVKKKCSKGGDLTETCSFSVLEKPKVKVSAGVVRCRGSEEECVPCLPLSFRAFAELGVPRLADGAFHLCDHLDRVSPCLLSFSSTVSCPWI